MRKPRRVAGLQGAGGVAVDMGMGSSVGTRVSGASTDLAGVVMPESSKWNLSREKMIVDVGRCCLGWVRALGEKILYRVGGTGSSRSS